MICRLLFMALALFAWSAAPAQAENAAHRFFMAQAPKPVPAFTFADSEGHARTLKDFKGRFVLLNLWAVWCGPCVQEMPSLAALQDRLGRGRLTVVALNTDHDGIAKSRDFLARHNLSALDVYADETGRAGFVLGARGLPTTLLIDQKGREIGRAEGDVDWVSADVVSALEKALSTPSN